MKKQIIFLSAVLLLSTSMYAMESNPEKDVVVISDAARKAKAAVLLDLASRKDGDGKESEDHLVTTPPVSANASSDDELVTAAISPSIGGEKKGTCREWCEWAASLITGSKKKAE